MGRRLPRLRRAHTQAFAARPYTEAMKKLLELILCILHPVAVVLIWLNLLFRSDLGLIARLAWGIAVIVPFVPFLYVLTGNDFI
jgi:hypothetical protein